MGEEEASKKERLGAIQAAEPETHKELLRHVVVTGGLACMPGLAERFEDELRVAAASSLVPTIAQLAHRVSVTSGAAHDRRHGVWLGASILGSLSSHHELWMSRAEYLEHGPSLIGRKGMQYAW